MGLMDMLLRLLDRAPAVLKEFLNKCFQNLFFRTWLVCTGCATLAGKNQRLRYPFATKGAPHHHNYLFAPHHHHRHHLHHHHHHNISLVDDFILEAISDDEGALKG